MIQVGKLRKWLPKGETEEKVFFKAIKGFVYKDLKTLFDKIEGDLSKFLGEKEQFNIFYTVAHHLEGQRTKKSWQQQDIIPFDLDGIDLDKIDEYPQVIADACGFDLSKTAIIHSGNGCHILIKVEAFADTEFIKDNRMGYKQLYERIMKACAEANLPIEKDTTAWDYARILRCPGTKNIKIKEGVEVIKTASVFQNNLDTQDWTIPAVEKVDKALSIPRGSFPLPDADTILTECDFIKWIQACPDEVHEPHAYAMLSIAGHFKDDGDKAKEIWANFSSPSINSKDVNEFLEQALSASGPRTCAGIDDIYGKCNRCPHYQKVTSPILLKSDDYIGTEDMGFTTRSISGKSLNRHYDDLLNYFKREHHYKHVGETNDIYVYDETHYKPYHPVQIKKYAQDKFTKPVKESERVEYLRAVEAGDYTGLSWLENKPQGLINLQNGILNLSNKEMLPHSHEHNFITCLPFDYDPDATCPTWDKFMSDITLGKEDLANILHEYMGYCAYGGEYLYHKALVLSGSGKNGKSTFIDVLRAIVGNENIATVPLTSLGKDNFAMADMQGKLVNISEEEPASCFKETGVFKNLTGNNVVRAQKKFKNSFKMLSRAKIVITYNELPFISDTTTGMKRRLLVIPFKLDLENNPTAVNSNIKFELMNELPGIFNRVLEGWLRLNEQNDFTKSESVNEAVKEVMENSNSFLMWFDECIEITRGEADRISYRDMYSHYCEFMEAMRERNIMGRRKFSQELLNKGFKVTTMRIKGSDRVQKGVQGVRLAGGVEVRF